MNDTNQKDPINISVRVFDEQQRDFLESTIRLCKPKLQGEWQLCSPSNADVLFVCPQDPGVDTLLSSYLGKSDKYPVIYSTKNNTLSPWFVKRPVQKEELIKFLNSIYDTIHGIAATASTHATIDSHQKRISTPVSRSDKQKKLSIFDKLCAYSELIELQMDGGQSIVFNPATKIFYSDTADNNAHLITALLSPQHWKGKRLKNESDDIGEMNELCHIDELRWSLSKHNMGKTEKLENSVIRLKSWPNFNYLSHESHDFILAAFFCRYASTIASASQKTGISQDSIFSFCRAADAAGLLQVVDKEDSQVTTNNTAQRKNRVISTIVKHLRRDTL